MTAFAVLNQSTRFDDLARLDAGCQAIQDQLAQEVASAWGPEVAYPVRRITSASDAKPGDILVYVLDTLDVPDAGGYHDEQGGIVFARVGVSVYLDNGGTLDDVLVALGHEILETAGNATANAWRDRGDGWEVAAEWCDPVEATTYTVQVGGYVIPLTDFVLPAWFDPQSTQGPYSYCNGPGAPFAIMGDGYCIERNTGTEQQVFGFGPSVPEWKRKAKQAALARPTRRLRAKVVLRDEEGVVIPEGGPVAQQSPRPPLGEPVRGGGASPGGPPPGKGPKRR